MASVANSCHRLRVHATSAKARRNARRQAQPRAQRQAQRPAPHRAPQANVSQRSARKRLLLSALSDLLAQRVQLVHRVPRLLVQLVLLAQLELLVRLAPRAPLDQLAGLVKMAKMVSVVRRVVVARRVRMVARELVGLVANHAKRSRNPARNPLISRLK